MILFFIFLPYFWPFCENCDVYNLMVECSINVLVANGLFHDILCRSKSQAKSLSRCQLPPNMMSFGQMRKDLLKIYCKDTKELFLRHTLYNAILRIARNFLETRGNIKISTHPFYHINLGWFSWEWSKFFFFFRKKNSKWPTQKKLIFQNRQFSKIFRQNFSDGSLG